MRAACPRTVRRLIGAVAVVGLVAAGCTSDDEDADDAIEETDNVDVIDEVSAADGEDAEATGGDRFDCSLESLQGGDEEFAFVAAYDVIDGELDGLCFGDDDTMTVGAWELLATIAPAQQLSDIGLMAGYEPDGDLAAETLAFVSALDADGTGFLMAVNTVVAADDPDELSLTMAHEFTHVFTATPEQLDRTDDAIDACATYFSGEGCYLPDSLMWAWIGEFWDDDVLATVDVSSDDPDAADARCLDDDGFFGAYAATNPEEDFAEAFSAYVFDVEPATEGQAERLEWIAAQPGLVEFRSNAEAAGLTPLPNNFDVCGT